MKKNNTHDLSQGQVILEYTLCLIIVLLLIYGCIMIFRWAGVNLADERIGHDASLRSKIEENWGSYTQSPLNQVRPDFAEPTEMNFVFNGW